MNAAEALWKENLQRLGAFIRAQRQFHRLSQRELARLADLSDTYMSQLERGMHEPSVRVLRAVAEGLGVKASQLIMFAAGLPADEDDDISTEEAILRDPRFTDAQRRALLSVVKSFVESKAT